VRFYKAKTRLLARRLVSIIQSVLSRPVMKLPISALICFAFAVINLQGQSLVAQPQVNVPSPTPYIIVSQDGNSRVWQREEYAVQPGRGVVTNTSKYTELATGLNYLDICLGVLIVVSVLNIQLTKFIGMAILAGGLFEPWNHSMETEILQSLGKETF